MEKKWGTRVVSFLLVLMVLFSCAGCENQRTQKVRFDNPTDSFASVIQNVINKYGIMDEAKAEISYEIEKPLSGFLDAEYFDVTGDGNDEMVLLFYDAGKIHMQIYEHKKGVAQRLWNHTTEWGGIFRFSAYKSNGIAFWTWYPTRHYPADVVAFIDGECRSGGEKGNFTEEELSRYRNGDSFSTGSEEGEAFFRILQDRLNIGGDIDEELYSYHVEGTFHPVNSEELQNRWGVKTPKPRVSPQQALEGIHYFGNKEICKMTKEMAEAYAKAIEKDKALIQPNVGDSYTYRNRLFAALVDVANDGMPLLLTALGGDSAYDKFRDLGEIYIWTWNGTEAIKYDFYQDIECEFIFDMRFYQGDGKGTIRIEDGVGISVGDAFGWIEYSVSNAQMKKVDHIMYYNAYVDGNIARGTFLPGVNAKKIDYGMEANVQDLLDAGWVGEVRDDGYGSLNIYKKNGKLISYGDLEGYQKYWEEYSYSTWEQKEEYEIMEPSTGISGLHKDVGPADDAIKALEAYAQVAGKPYYSYEEVSYVLTENQLKAMTEEAAKKYQGQVGEIYRLSDDLYYIVLYIDDTFSGGVLVKNIDNGMAWRTIAYSDQPFTEERLAQETSQDHAVSNIKINYQETKNAEKYLREVFADIDGTVPNNAAKEEIADYVQGYISANSEDSVRAKNNCVTIHSDAVEDAVEDAMESKAEVEAVLEEENITLNKQITVIIRLVCKNIDAGEPVQVVFDESCLEIIGDADAISLVLGKEDGYGVKITKDALGTMLGNHGSVTVVLHKTDKNNYDIQYLDPSGALIEKLDVSLTFAVPAANELCTVQAEYTGGTDNWGGQFDAVKKEISFETPYSGSYTVIEDNTDITDISELSEEYQEAIRFMVSKGYFNVSDGKFDPNGTLTRYHFSEALVRMFFILDRSLSTTFSDVPKDNPYYAYVASGEQANIIEGYEDMTFRGESNVLREEVIALCSRTLRERKGYIEPERPYEYLHFTDNDKIAQWSEKVIALAVREKLIDDGGVLDPASAISRADSALLLYRLFMLLYEVEPVATNTFAMIQIILIAVIGVCVIGIIICFIFLKKKKQTTESPIVINDPDEPSKMES